MSDYLAQKLAELVQGLLALCLGGLGHKAFMHQQREVHGRSVHAAFQKPLGYIQGMHAVRRRGHKLMHAEAVKGFVQHVLELDAQVVGIEDCVFSHPFQSLAAQAPDVGQSLQKDAEAAVEGTDMADAELVLRQEVIAAVFCLAHPGRGQEGNEALAHAHRTGTRTAAAMRRAKGLVQVQMHHVKAGIAHTHLAKNGVHVGAVIVEECVNAVQQGNNFLEVQFHQAQCVGAGHHQACHLVAVLVDSGLDCGRIHHAVLGLDVDDSKAGHGRRGRVGAVGSIRNQHDAAVTPLGPVIGGNNGHAGELAVGAGHGLQGKALHAGDGAKAPFKLIEALHGALAAFAVIKQGLHGMRPVKAGKSCDFLADPGVVLHRAGS